MNFSFNRIPKFLSFGFFITSLFFMGCRPSINLNMDESEGISNIYNKAMSLKDSNTQITSLRFYASANSSSSEVYQMELSVSDSARNLSIFSKYNFDKDELERKTDQGRYATCNPDLSKILSYIEQSKTQIPEGYKYLNVRSISFTRSHAIFTIEVEPIDEYNVKKTKSVKTHKKKQNLLFRWTKTGNN